MYIYVYVYLCISGHNVVTLWCLEDETPQKQHVS